MKVILLEDVYKKGVAGEVVDVAPGYARNYLIPRKMAVKATPGSLRQLENLRSRAEVRRDQRQNEYAAIASKIEEITLYFSVRAGETGKLYGSVTSAEIAEELNKAIGLDIDRRRIGDRSLRELGSYSVPVRLDAGLTPNVKVIIFREGDDPRTVEAAEAEAEQASAEESATPELVTEADVEAVGESEPAGEA
jgi:large subunit ribosomal protein L9